MRYFFPLCLIVLFASCHSAPSTADNATPDAIDLSARDSSVRPQDNFFQYANGTWLKNTSIPVSQTGWGNFYILEDSSLNRQRYLLDSLSGIKNSTPHSVAQLTADLYASAMDSAGIEQKGIAPVKPELDSIDAITDFHAVLKEIGREYRLNHNPFFSLYVSPDDRNSMVYIAHLDQGGLGMPNSDYYINKDPSILRIRNGYKILATKFFQLMGADSVMAGRKATALLALETSLAKVSKSPVQQRDPVENYHKYAVKSLNGIWPSASELLNQLTIHADTVLVGQPDFYKGLGSILQKTPLTEIKDYLRFHVLLDDAPYLSTTFVNDRFQYYQLLNGTKQIRERWKRMVGLVDQTIGDALGQLYVQKYFPPAAKERMQGLVANLMAAYEERIKQLDWMSDSTKQKAIVKLHAIVKKIGYPDTWKDYSSISMSRDNVIENIQHASLWQYNRDIAKIGKPVDRKEWFMTPPTIDAYYDPTQNNINFPAGILQPPFFFLDGDDAVNYGGIGFVIGHEITHGFDDGGRQYDADGNLKDWWSPADAKNFTARVSNVIKQYNNYLVIDTFHINGSLTQGENLADNGGLAISYAAFKKTKQGQGNELINGLTPDQRFFFSAAQVWRMKSRDETVRTQIMTNPHSPEQYRVNGPLSNMPAFYQAFNVTPADSMYRPDSLRVKVW